MKSSFAKDGTEFFFDDSDLEYVESFSWYVNDMIKWKYVTRREDNRTIMLHRELLSAPEGIFVDHLDGNGLNNVRSNIRLATKSQNQYNRGPQDNNTSGFKGVYWHKQSRKWQAQIGFQNRKIHIGFYSSAVEAAAAYDLKALELHGEFARVNLPLP